VNREQKIALILGFAVILVVGILVSDHWSRARELELADAAEGDGSIIQQTPIAALPGPGEVSQASYAARELDAAPRPTETAPAFEPVEQASLPPVLPSEVVTIAQGSGATDSPLESALDGSNGVNESQPDWLSRFSRLAQDAGRVLPEAARLELPQSQRPGAGPVVQETQSEPAPRRVRHTVAKNESLFAIAKTYYGDGNQWRRIAEANGPKVGKDGGVRQGVTLDIPGAPEKPTPAPGGRQPERTAGEPASRVAAAPTTYTVKRNDSLSEISQRFLGSSKRMREIIAANSGKISDPNDIRIGMVLTIPGKS
jgi:nucleoid-associated protein YgaU